MNKKTYNLNLDAYNGDIQSALEQLLIEISLEDWDHSHEDDDNGIEEDGDESFN